MIVRVWNFVTLFRNHFTEAKIYSAWNVSKMQFLQKSEMAPWNGSLKWVEVRVSSERNFAFFRENELNEKFRENAEFCENNFS